MNPKECITVPQQPTTPAMHDCLRESKKLKPEIRVVHVSSPEIIKTDAANFRELEKHEEYGCGKGAKRGSEVEETRELWVEKNSGCFSSKFGEIDSFLQELSDVPLPPWCSSPRVEVVGEAPASYQKN
ncbi:hypothetical protein C4D60_Mb06t22050 [Musa balbisiana]|uniref:VQ domain-containing protein n=1 Tax=Musa balbisiana TaxID=52838 RepID=A0A4S8IPT5_MUSBA|nr:hypothetical protein C4D60_Mb06t22050 [Musa balbisiana]